ncbi:hypothetical protein A0H81_09201 [Grifola frondosa]|uniref:BTB domain-containing protein n=1 Tax=Grifola frondosa TaxID=5627 RepID=A0A1C7M1N2_GRIFR|nr:hypothetical protein A0H81_09201 [Grifola frondosa]
MASSAAADPQEPSVTGARAPFDDADADLIIRCPDGAEFWVYKSILARASPVFKEMFAFPPPPFGLQHDPSNKDYRNSVPVVDVSEDTHAMELLLTFCYPMKAPKLKTFEDIQAAAEAGKKYEMTELVQFAREALPVFAQSNAPLAYVLACVFRWSQEARAAAKLTLREPWDAMCRPSPQLNCIDTSDYCKLQDYYSRCRRGVIAISSASLNDYCIPRSCYACSKLRDGTPNWFRTYADAIFPALRERP